MEVGTSDSSSSAINNTHTHGVGVGVGLPSTIPMEDGSNRKISFLTTANSIPQRVLVKSQNIAVKAAKESLVRGIETQRTIS
jgi:hypothetical protein